MEDQPIEQQQQDIETQQYLKTLEHFTVQLTIKVRHPINQITVIIIIIIIF